MQAQQTSKKWSRSSDETGDDTDTASKSLDTNESVKPAEPVKKDQLVIVKTYPFVDLVSDSDVDDDSASSDVQPPPKKKVKFAQFTELITSTTPSRQVPGHAGGYELDTPEAG